MELFGIDVRHLVEAAGILGVGAIIFAESGLLIGFFLPGDSLIFTAGLLASQGYMSLPWLLIVGCVAAITGDNVGYHFGRRYGPRIFKREDSLLFHKDHIQKAEAFYKKHGPITIILARFTPIVRTFAPILAGVGNMNYRTFFVYNVIGGLIWVIGLGLLGYFIGNTVPNVDQYILPGVVGIIILSILPGIVALIRNWLKKR